MKANRTCWLTLAKQDAESVSNVHTPVACKTNCGYLDLGTFFVPLSLAESSGVVYYYVWKG